MADWNTTQTQYGSGTPNLSPQELAGLNALDLWVYHVGHPADVVAANAAITAANATPGTATNNFTTGQNAMDALESTPAAPFVEAALQQTYNTGGVSQLGSEIGQTAPSPSPSEPWPEQQGLNLGEDMSPGVAGQPWGSTGVTCPYCGQIFNSENDLYSHVLTEHSGGNTGNTLGGTNMADTDYFSEYSPFAYYAKQKGIPGMGQNPLQQWQQSQFNPAYGTYQAQSYLNPGSATDWGQYLGGTGAMGARNAAPALFRQAASNTGVGEQQGFMDVLGSYFNDFMYNALRGSYAAPVAERMASRLPGLEQQYTGETQGAGNTFLSWLLGKYRL
jgi:hypothetical protein